MAVTAHGSGRKRGLARLVVGLGVLAVAMGSLSAGDARAVEADTDGPTVVFAPPINSVGAEFAVNEPVTASFSCDDQVVANAETSGVASCVASLRIYDSKYVLIGEWPVSNGAQLDTSVVGNYMVTVLATDRAGNKSTVQQSLRVVTGMTQVTGTVRDPAGQPVAGATVELFPASHPDMVKKTVTDGEGGYSIAVRPVRPDIVPWPGWDARVMGPSGSDLGAAAYGETITEGRVWDWSLAPLVHVSAITPSLDTTPANPPSWKWGIGSEDHNNFVWSPTLPNGGATWSAAIVPGTYRIQTSGEVDCMQEDFCTQASFAPREFLADTVVDLRPTVGQVQVSIRNTDGSNASADVVVRCMEVQPAGTDGLTMWTHSRSFLGSSDFTLWGSPTREGQPCAIAVIGRIDDSEVYIDPAKPTRITFLIDESGAVTRLDPEVNNDSDSIPDAVELLAPNNGDGNHDGLQDAAQVNVTSLPAAVTAEGASDPSYVTIGAPEGTTLSEVRTIDPTDTSQIPIPPPAGMTLSDGLVGFVVNDVPQGEDQVISIWVPSTAGLTGYAKYDPKSQTWSLLPKDRLAIFPDHVEISLTDGGVGDADGVANGSIDDPGGLVFDRTPPTITIHGVDDGASYLLGKAPAPTCTAADNQSGLDLPCVAELTGGTTNGVGRFTYTATATDKAGNTSTQTAGFRVVYRFDGFAQPINDESITPGITRSVFKAGSTVPVKIQLKTADGTPATPSTAPLWITPQKGSPTSATPNEQEWSDTATTGTVFESTGDSWHYNWSTKKADSGCLYRIGVKLDDGTTHTVTIALK